MKAPVGNVLAASSSSPLRRPRPVKRKQRCWSFLVTGISKDGPELKVADVLTSFRERYTAVKHITLSSANGVKNGNINMWDGVRAIVQFIGPQPSQGPGELLRQLLSGTAVDTDPIILGRGRKPKPTRVAVETSDSDLDNSSEPDMSPRDGMSMSCLEDDRSRRPPVHGDVRLLPEDPHDRKFCQADNSSWSTTNHGGLFKHPSYARVSRCDVRMMSEDDTMQWDDVVSRVQPPPPARGLPAPQHSLDIGALYVSSESDDPDMSEFADSDDGELPASRGLAPSSPIRGGLSRMSSWRSGDFADDLMSALPSSLRRSEWPEKQWSFSTARGTIGDGPCLDGSSTEAARANSADGSKAAVDPVAPASAAEFGWGATPGVSTAPQVQDSVLTHRTTGKTSLCAVPASATPKRPVTVKAMQQPQECDFDGFPIHSASTCPRPSPQFRLEFTGLQSLGEELHKLTAIAYFGVHESPKVMAVAGPIQIGQTGGEFAGVFYPSMREICPDVYGIKNVRIVEVDMCVEIRSTDNKFHHMSPNLKVVYRRSSEAVSGAI